MVLLKAAKGLTKRLRCAGSVEREASWRLALERRVNVFSSCFGLAERLLLWEEAIGRIYGNDAQYFQFSILELGPVLLLRG